MEVETAVPNAPSKKPIFFVIGIFLFAAFLIVWLFMAIKPAVKNEKIFASNLSETGAVISWVSAKPVGEWLLVSEKNGTAPTIFKDDKEKNFLPFGAFSLHYFSVSGLKANTSYKYKIYQGFKETSVGTFTTTPKVVGARLSKTVSGKVLFGDQKIPLGGAVVYLQLLEGAQRSTLLSAITDSKGKWSANILGAKTSSLKSDFKIASRSALLLVAETGGQGRFNATFPIDSWTKTLPNLILKGGSQ